MNQKRAILVGGSLYLVAIVVAGFTAWQLAKNGSGSAGRVRDLRSYLPAPEGRPSVSVPSPTPLVGPGTFACDHYGICNFYDENKRAACPKTYADRLCLNECEKTEVRCPK